MEDCKFHHSSLFVSHPYLVVYASGPKTVLVKRAFLLACVRRSCRGHVNVPCTSSAKCCYAAQMSGSVASLYT